jgi:DNA polymerase type B, organellar and viral
MYEITRGCREKTLLVFLEHKLLNVLDRGFTLYQRFYTSFSSDANIASFERKPGLVDDVFKQLYNYSETEKKPEGFDISKHSDLQRLALFLNATLVIYNNDLAHLWFSSWKKTERCDDAIYFLFKNDKVYYLQQQQPNPCTVVEKLCQNLENNSASFQERFERIMQFPPLEQYSNLSAKEFAEKRIELSELYKLNQCVILFFYSGCPHKTTRRYNLHVFLQSFIQLGVEPKTIDDVQQSTPLIVYFDIIGVPSTALMKRLKQQLLGNLTDFPLGVVRKRKRKSIAKAKRMKMSSETTRLEKICKCHICTEETLPNMSENGQERLCTIKPSSYDLLTMLGISTDRNKHIINQLCEMSIASVDIESMTQATDNENSIQKPLMVGHCDCLDDTQIVSLQDYLDEGSDTETESNIFKMMESYWNHVVLVRYNRITEKKRELAQPLLDHLSAYNREHVSFCREFCKDDTIDVMIANYRNTIPGILEEKIKKLIQQYLIFSFYGSGYDMVLLENYLIPLLFEQDLRPKIEKKGNKVSIIRIKNGIQFRDISKMLAPSTNLRSFGQMFGLSIEKGHFPFGILSHVQSLRLTQLPTRLKLWQSELTGKAITKKNVQEAIDFYTRSGFTNVGEYLQHYLVKDVQILQQATNLWRKRLLKLIGLDFVDVQRFTISSLSSYASAHTVALHHKPGWFFPNNSQNYALLKKGMRG